MPNINERLELLERKINDAKLHLAGAMEAFRVELEVMQTLLERQSTEFSEFSAQAKRAGQSVANRSNSHRPGQSDPHQTMTGLETTGKVQHG